MRIVRLTLTEFETEDGAIYPIVPSLTKEMIIEEFQKHYDISSQIVSSIKNAGSNNPDTKKLV